ncbi:rhamnulokinase [Agarivorans sp. TSD2052]|uniref:rhamnulokinase n=1 Tax=Agarivorans sp. TSD2052 TaxID=2937286 RepID=UPI00200F916E|nr:rhamnulokinase [Agarivorans sp. TSD2052]UPW18812.1 rhamnulokinase [Agarivorans sp. TSD2052]
MNKMLAIDIGASSGRVILGIYDDQTLQIQEIHRFENGPVFRDGQACWNLDYLLLEIKRGIAMAGEAGHVIESLAIDTWGVDFVLLDVQGKQLGEAVSYRDDRTAGIQNKLNKLISRDTIYSKTGIQFLDFNTLYQLTALMENPPSWINSVARLLFIPDYLSFKLSKVQHCEYTNASTSQLLNCANGEWDKELLDLIKVPEHWFLPAEAPNRLVGYYHSKAAGRIRVTSIASHDTASAILALPVTGQDTVYISSGTWSLMGFESEVAINNPLAQSFNVTNEGGAENRFRVLKNIMGLWLIQNVQKELGEYSFTTLVTLAKQSEPFRSLIAPDHPRFLNPVCMSTAIQDFCEETAQAVPETPGEFARCIFESLACQYRKVWLELNQLNPASLNRIHIIGGGIQNKLLNQLCADACGVEVSVGPIEASAIGNICGQLIALKQIDSVQQARNIVSNSFPIETYKPNQSSDFLSHWAKFERISLDTPERNNNEHKRTNSIELC